MKHHVQRNTMYIKTQCTTKHIETQHTTKHNVQQNTMYNETQCTSKHNIHRNTMYNETKCTLKNNVQRNTMYNVQFFSTNIYSLLLDESQRLYMYTMQNEQVQNKRSSQTLYLHRTLPPYLNCNLNMKLTF